MNSIKAQIVPFLVKYGFQIIGGLVILAVGFFVAQAVGRLFQKSLARFKLEKPVELLFVRLAKLLIIGLTAVITVSSMGVDIAPFVAGIGVVGVGIGLAAQGVLSNIFAGLLIIFTKPFKLGQYIEIHEVDGVVHEIGLISTKLQHFDRSIVVIPNRKITGEILHNYGTMRQIEVIASVAYNSDMTQLESIIKRVLAENSRVLKDPAPVFGVKELGNSTINITVRPWVNVPDFPFAPAELYRALLDAFQKAGIEVPVPQREIRILNYPSPGQSIPGLSTRTDARI